LTIHRPKLQLSDVPDVAWPASNAMGVPDLLLAKQATELRGPLVCWGTRARSGVMPGTWHFYADDYRFTALWGAHAEE